MNLRDGVLYEGVLSVLYKGAIYAAPVGFRKSGKFIAMKIYKGGQLERVVKELDEVIINVTHDPTSLMIFAFKGLMRNNESMNTYFRIIDNRPVLINGYGFLVLRKTGIVDQGDYYQVEYEIRSIEPLGNDEIEPYTRCYSSMIEIAIYLSKLMALKNDHTTYMEYAKRIEIARDVVLKTCNEEYLGILDEILSKVDST